MPLPVQDCPTGIIKLTHFTVGAGEVTVPQLGLLFSPSYVVTTDATVLDAIPLTPARAAELTAFWS